MAPDQQSAKYWLGKDIEDAVECRFGIWRNEVSTLADTPGNRVEDPEEGSQASTIQESFSNVFA